MSDETRQKVYDEAMAWIADAEQSLDGLIAAIKEHRTAERNEAGPTEPEPTATPTSEQSASSSPDSETSGESEAATDPPAAA